MNEPVIMTTTAITSKFNTYKVRSLAGTPAASLIMAPVTITGALSERLLGELLTEYDRLTPTSFSSSDVQPDFYGTALGDEVVAQLNRDHAYFEISGLFRLLIWRFVRALKFSEDKIVLDILNIRAWTTHPAEHSEFGPTGWHGDGMPESMLKIMIYLTEVGGSKGTIQIRHSATTETRQELKGPPGQFVLFNNSMIEHRGVAPSLGFPPRKCVEVTVTPLPDTVAELPFPKVGGLSARHPLAYFYDITGMR